jgi:hypothetical protein
MTSVVGPQGADGGGLDLLAVNRDADLLDLLARRGEVPSGDPVLALLAALAADVDEGLDELLVAREDDPLVRAARAATALPGTPAARTGHGLRATTVAVVVGATLSLGGVAAAVTGDPLAPVKGIATAVGIGSDKHEGKANAQVAVQQGRSALAHGDIAGAQASLATMKAQLLRDDLSKGDRRSIEARIAALQKQVDRAVAAQAAEQPGNANDNNGGGDADDGTDAANDKATNGKGEKASSGKPDGKPNATRTAEPAAGDQGRTRDEDQTADPTTDPTSGATTAATTGASRPSDPAGSGNRGAQPTPSTTDDSPDAPASATAEPATSGDAAGSLRSDGRAGDGTDTGKAGTKGGSATG